MRPAGKHGVLVCGRDVRLFDPANGREKWRLTAKDVPKHKDQRRTPAVVRFNGPAVHGNTIYVTAFKASVLAVDLSNGRRRWI